MDRMVATSALNDGCRTIPSSVMSAYVISASYRGSARGQQNAMMNPPESKHQLRMESAMEWVTDLPPCTAPVIGHFTVG
jgi:hypothetical protein